MAKVERPAGRAAAKAEAMAAAEMEVAAAAVVVAAVAAETDRLSPKRRGSDFGGDYRALSPALDVSAVEDFADFVIDTAADELGFA